MPSVSVGSFPLFPGSVQILDRTRHTLVDGQPRADLFTHVIVASDIEYPEGLKRAIRAAVREFVGSTNIGQTVNREEKERTIKGLREMDEKDDRSTYSRQCSICFARSPSSRAVLTACGHTACMACVMQMEVDGRLQCPFCRKRTGFVKLHEEKDEDGEEEEGKNEAEKDAAYQIETGISSLSLSPSIGDSTSLSSPPTYRFPPPPIPTPFSYYRDTPPPTLSATQRYSTPPTVTQPTVPSHYRDAPPPSLSSTHSVFVPPADYRIPPPTRPAASSTPRTRIRISNLSPTITSSQLRTLFSRAGEVLSVHIHIDERAGRPCGLAFCDFADEETAQVAVEMFNGKLFGGGVLRVRLAYSFIR